MDGLERGPEHYLIRKASKDCCALQAGIAESSAVGDMTPKGKAEFVYDLRREGRKVSMVGDGINDAPALAASDAGMAFKSGLDVAGEAASVILMSDRLGQVSQKLNVRSRCGLRLEFHAR